MTDIILPEEDIIEPILETLPKPKKKKKGYFDNGEMLDWLRKRNALKFNLVVEIKSEKPELKDSKAIVCMIEHIEQTPVHYDGKEYDEKEFVKLYDKVNNEVGKLYIKVADGMMKRPNFINYPPDQKIDMLSDALYFMSRAGERYDVNYPNPFAYFSQITFNSFLQSIKNMKKRITTFVCVDHLENFDRVIDE